MELLEQIEAYLARTRTPPSKFGRTVVADPRFVQDLRAGRLPRRKTCQKVSEFLVSTEEVMPTDRR
jgi:2,4-dienoyl-CoA reductase-like NADH-dependent reductase (Old Yellow Enzyme family)